jgi:nicotinamide riboside transporter PnuC
MWILTALSLAGVILNIKKKKSCFIIWAFTNFSWAIVDFRAGLHAQSALFTIYFCLAVWGLIEWGRKTKTQDCSVPSK